MQTSTRRPEPARGKARGFDRLPQRTFAFRLAGMALGALCIGMVLRENGASALTWALCAFTGFVWPPLALLVARRSASPYRAELRNLLLDSAQTGFWVAMMQFNLLPSVLLFTLVTVDKISTGVPRLWLWSLPVFAGGMLVGAVSTGFSVRLDTSTAVLLACLPMLMIHPISVALAGNRLVQQIRHKNRLLDQLSRTDSLTGLQVRRHWQSRAERALRQHQADGTPATLLLDVDHFKVTNDRHGHSVGDDVLRGVAAAISASVRPQDESGRYGGDEFGVLLHGTSVEEAQVIADGILQAVSRVDVSGAPGTTVTVSIGIAAADAAYATLEEWIGAADAALYRAKRGGRNRIAA